MLYINIYNIFLYIFKDNLQIICLTWDVLYTLITLSFQVHPAKINGKKDYITQNQVS